MKQRDLRAAPPIVTTHISLHLGQVVAHRRSPFKRAPLYPVQPVHHGFGAGRDGVVPDLMQGGGRQARRGDQVPQRAVAARRVVGPGAVHGDGVAEVVVGRRDLMGRASLFVQKTLVVCAKKGEAVNSGNGT